ncbi:MULTISPECIES: ABC transporter substrate-binding protein [Enterococcus]|uniref:ABC transporter substrate-binding protein n=1 Tax=Enterococcus TaxID=1350 RepID=UPI0010FF8970|nr:MULTISPECIES: ABC transporter substrate-binding protein [Enterococcus]MBO6418776.1 hypothetical protein [Enterococcus gallinarum]MBO6420679.1 hypothetical protein [Enterococcus gallinarum]QCT90772.1 hypothetical protein FE005_01830 [Enterococcus sp. M190262]GMG57779.1 ABC transporter substrate-binding protein [Enterococcus gallinarum]
MKKFKGLVCLAALFLLTACGEETKETDQTAQDSQTLVINGDYVVPPTAHGNPYISGFIGGGIEPYVQEALFSFTPVGEGGENFKPRLASSYSIDQNVINITLKEGIKWSDGSDITAQDVLTSYQMWVGKKQIWEFLEKIEVPDEQTVAFHFKNESHLMLNLLTDVKVAARFEEYGDWAQQYQGIADAQREWHDETNTYWFSEAGNEQLQILNEELEGYMPQVTDMVGSGAFTIANLSTSEAVLEKNEHFYQETSIDSLTIIRAVTPEVAANSMIDGTLDMHSGGMTEDLIRQVESKLDYFTEFYLPEYSQMSVVFNVKQAFAQELAFREAVAYLVNPDEILPLAEVGSMPSEMGSTGLPLSLQEVYGLTDWVQSELTAREYNVEQAEAVLLAAGWTKEDTWIDAQGNKVAFDFACNNGWGSALLPGEAIVNELNSFGFDVTFLPMEGASYDAYLRNGEHTVAIEFAPPSNILYANPYGTYEQLYKGRSWLFGLETEPTGELYLTNAQGKVDVIALTNHLFDSEGDDFIATTKELMAVTNEHILFIPYLEKGFPVRVLNPAIDFQVPANQLVQDPRFIGVGESMFSSLIAEGTLRKSMGITD